MGTRIRVRLGQPPRLAPAGPDGKGFAHVLVAMTVLASLACLTQDAVLLAVLAALPGVALLVGDRQWDAGSPPGIRAAAGDAAVAFTPARPSPTPPRCSCTPPAPGTCPRPRPLPRSPSAGTAGKSEPWTARADARTEVDASIAPQTRRQPVDCAAGSAHRSADWAPGCSFAVSPSGSVVLATHDAVGPKVRRHSAASWLSIERSCPQM